MSRTRRDPTAAGWLMLAPFLLLFLCFSVVPMVFGVLESLKGTTKNPKGGFSTYTSVFHDFRFIAAIKHTATYILISVPLMTLVVLALALAFDAYRSSWHKYVRLAYLLPGCYVGAAGILVWYIASEPLIGPFRTFLNAIGIHSQSEIFKPNSLAVIFAFMVVISNAGGWIVVQFGGLQEVSEEVIEAAKIDGCNNLQLATKIKLPLIRKNVVYMVVLVIAGSIQLFAEPFILNSALYRGLSDNWSINQLSYTLAFQEGDFSSASAISILLLLGSLSAALFLIFKTKFFETGLE